MSESGASGSDEREVIRRVLSGEKEEFRHLVRAHQDRVFAMLMRQVANEAIAGELAQEVMIRAYLSLDRFRGECRFSTWLARIALNAAASYFSSREFKQRARTMALEAAPAQAGTDDGQTPGAPAKLKAALGSLRPKYREVVVLCGFERRSYKEAAEILGVPEGTVCSRLSAARAKLRKQFKR